MNQEFQAQEVIKNHVMMSMGAGLVPIPLVDFVAVTAVQVDMLKQLAYLYDVPYYENSGKGLVTALTGTSLASIGASVFKAIPGVGSLLGGLSMAIMSGASTYAVGGLFARHFAAGGTLSDFDPSSMKEEYKEEFQRGKQKAKEWKAEKEQSETATTTNSNDEELFQKLERLGALKEKGILSEAEFEKMKAKILEEF